MTTTEAPGVQEISERRDALIGRLFEATLGVMDLYSVYFGDALGLYRSLKEEGPANPAELAARTKTHERYIREWLEQQAVTGFLEVEDVAAGENERRYSLPAGYEAVLIDTNSLAYLAPLARIPIAITPQMPKLLEAYRNGGGVSWAEFGKEAREAQEALNRPAYQTLIANDWFPGIPGLQERLQGDPPARVADLGCGAGWSSISIAQGYPNALVDGFDVDRPSIETAIENARTAGIADRVRFVERDAGDAAITGSYDLVTAFECVHDLSNPVEVLATMRRLLTPDGFAIVMDEKVAETFTAPGDMMERFFYGASIALCLPAGMAGQPSAGTGTVMRPDTLRSYARQAGFSDIEVLPVEHDFFRFYRLVK